MRSRFRFSLYQRENSALGSTPLHDIPYHPRSRHDGLMYICLRLRVRGRIHNVRCLLRSCFRTCCVLVLTRALCVLSMGCDENNDLVVDSHQRQSSSAARPLGHSSTRIEPAPVVSPSQLPRIHYSAPRKSLWLVARGCHHILWERLFWSAG